MKRFLALVVLLGCIVIAGCSREVKQTKTASSSVKITKDADDPKNQKALLKEIEQLKLDPDTKMWNKYYHEETILTATNGVKKLNGDKQIVGYKTYKVLDSWLLDRELTKDQEKDVVWELVNGKEWKNYVEIYMLPTYKGNIADLTGERLTEADLDDILAKDGMQFTQKGSTKIKGEKWHVGLEMGSENNVVRVTFYKMEPDKGSFNESVQVIQVLAPLNKVTGTAKDRAVFFDSISQVKRMITTFSKTKEKELPFTTDDPYSLEESTDLAKPETSE